MSFRDNCLPIDNPKKIEILLNFSEEQFQKIIKGFYPCNMEDKWLIYYENKCLHFHRSWTGFEIYKAEILKKPDGYLISEFLVERNQEKYQNSDDNYDITLFKDLIFGWLLYDEKL